jgi:hypothetical protein
MARYRHIQRAIRRQPAGYLMKDARACLDIPVFPLRMASSMKDAV